MVSGEKISSLQNPKIKQLKRLEKASERKEQNLIVIEGLRESVLAHRAGYQIQSLFVCNELLVADKNYPIRELQAAREIKERYEISEAVYHSLAYRESTEGIIVTAFPKQHSLQNLRLKSEPLVLVIESVEKPGNLGAMLRTCDAVAADAVIICSPKTDLYNPNVIRSSIGTVFTNQIAIGETHEVIAFLNKNNIRIFAADLTATKEHYKIDYKSASAFVVGSESEGLSAAWTNAADEKIKIPMAGKIDSLNVSVSAAILLFEAGRQRDL